MRPDLYDSCICADEHDLDSREHDHDEPCKCGFKCDICGGDWDYETLLPDDDCTIWISSGPKRVSLGIGAVLSYWII